MTTSEEYVSKINDIHYEYPIGLDGAIKKVDSLRRDISNTFKKPSSDLERILLNQTCDSKNQEVITECLKDLLLFRKERLSKLRIEYVITSIFDFIFRDFNLSRALESIYGPNYKDAIENPYHSNTVYCYIRDTHEGCFAKIALLNNAIPFIKIQGVMNEKPIVYFDIVSKDVIDNRNIYLLKSNEQYFLVEQLSKLPEEDGLLIYGGEVVLEAEAHYRFAKLQEGPSKNES